MKKLKNKLNFYKNLFLIKRSGLFDANYYVHNNLDVHAAKKTPAKHYLLYGGFENCNPSANFSSSFYLRYYPDVKSSGMNPLLHFIKYGKNEGRLTNTKSLQHSKKPIHLRKSNTSEYCRKFSNDLQDYVVPFHNLKELQLEVTTACNLACSQCFRYIEGHTIGHFSIKLWGKHIYPLLGQLKNIHLVGIGEPLLSKALFKFVTDAKKFNVTVHTTSNLQLLDQTMAEKMVKSGVDYLSFSCDGAKDETYAKIRVNGTLDILKKNLNLINEAKRKNKSSTPILTLNFGATRQNITELPDIVKLANDYDVSKIVVFHNVAYLKEQSEDSLFHDQEASDAYFNRALDMAEELGMPMELPDFFSTPIKNDPEKFFCEFPVERIYIYHDGRVGPCCMDFPDRIILGNINTSTLEEIWNDKPYLKLRKSINMKPSETCMFCVDSTKIDIIDPRFLFRFKDNKAYINSIKSQIQTKLTGIIL